MLHACLRRSALAPCETIKFSGRQQNILDRRRASAEPPSLLRDNHRLTHLDTPTVQCRTARRWSARGSTVFLAALPRGLAGRVDAGKRDATEFPQQVAERNDLAFTGRGAWAPGRAGGRAGGRGETLSAVFSVPSNQCFDCGRRMLAFADAAVAPPYLLMSSSCMVCHASRLCATSCRRLATQVLRATGSRSMGAKFEPHPPRNTALCAAGSPCGSDQTHYSSPRSKCKQLS